MFSKIIARGEMPSSFNDGQVPVNKSLMNKKIYSRFGPQEILPQPSVQQPEINRRIFYSPQPSVQQPPQDSGIIGNPLGSMQQYPYNPVGLDTSFPFYYGGQMQQAINPYSYFGTQQTAGLRNALMGGRTEEEIYGY